MILYFLNYIFEQGLYLKNLNKYHQFKMVESIWNYFDIFSITRKSYICPK